MQQFLDSITEAFSVLFMGNNFLRLLGGLVVTIKIAAVSIILSLFLGIIFGLVMTVKFKPLKIICHIYLEIMRIMSQMVLLFLAYYGLTRASGLSLTGEAASVLVFTLWGTAEMGDLVRGALKSMSRHQYESARAVGLTEKQIFIYVIMPQTVRRLVPLSMNLITRMIKTTSLVVFVGVIDCVLYQIAYARSMRNGRGFDIIRGHEEKRAEPVVHRRLAVTEAFARHCFQIQVLHTDELMPIGYLGRRLVEEVLAAISDVTVSLCSLDAQFLRVLAFGKRTFVVDDHDEMGVHLEHRMVV